MSIVAYGNGSSPYGDPPIGHLLDDLRPKRLKVERCPICGVAVLPGDNTLKRIEGFDVKDGHVYPCRNLSVTFCDECLTGNGGVDIICKAIEASSTLRAQITQDAYTILKKQHDVLMSTLFKWVVGIIISFVVVVICCLIWGPKNVFEAIGAIIVVIAIFALLSVVNR